MQVAAGCQQHLTIIYLVFEINDPCYLVWCFPSFSLYQIFSTMKCYGIVVVNSITNSSRVDYNFSN